MLLGMGSASAGQPIEFGQNRRMTTHTRYRFENGRSCIDLKVRHSRQLFDGRDPAPFNERDLDDDAVAYRLGAAQEIPRKQPLAIAVTISEEPEPRLAPDVIVEAVRRHFVYAGEQVERRLREHVRRGHMFLTVGLTVLALFLTLAELAASLPAGPLQQVLREGLVITDGLPSGGRSKSCSTTGGLWSMNAGWFGASWTPRCRFAIWKKGTIQGAPIMRLRR
jgi:hypothetical protein